MPPTIDHVPFEFRPDAWLLVAGLALGYLWALRNLGPRLADADELAETPRRRALFLSGLVVLAITVSWPLDTIGDRYLFSLHMVQYLLMSFVAAPLLLSGVPGWLLAELTHPVRWVVTIVSRPVVALLLFNAVLVVSHWPVLVDLYLRSEFVHFLMHVVWVGSALIFWMPIVNNAPHLYKKLTAPLQMGYLFLSSIIPTVPASFLTWADTPFYDGYTNAPRLWGVTALQDTQAAGVVMKIGAGFVMWSIIVVIFFRWAATQNEDRPRRVPTPAATPPAAPPAT